MKKRTAKDAQKAEAEALQEQIDRLVRGDTCDTDAKPDSLRDFIQEKMADDTASEADRLKDP